MKLSILTRALFMILAASLFGCVGSGSESPPPSSSDAGAEVLPASFDFGTVTPSSTPAPLVVKINSVGKTSLSVSNIVLSDETNFSIDLDGGPDPCGSSSPTLGPGETCTFEVLFNPTSPAAFTANVQIANNDQTRTVQLSGTSEAVTGLTLRINQVIAACPANDWTAYVSVTDQAGYPYIGLTQSEFSINMGGDIPIDEFIAPPTPPSPIAVVAVLDYSGSIADYPEIVSDMEEGLIEFIKQMNVDGQVVEIIKFSNEVEVVQVFSSDEALLENAIRSAFVGDGNTSLNDAVYQAVADLSAQVSDRKAILVLTDGIDNDSDASLTNVIDFANIVGIPVFPIALGATTDLVSLGLMADETGGQLYEASTSDNIRNAYWQLASLLFQSQYVLSFDDLPLGGAENLTVTVSEFGGSSDIKSVKLCPLP